jgi:hypothetical protein
MASPRNELDEALMQLTLQLRNKKDNDKKYAEFHGDSLIGNPIIAKVGTLGDLAALVQPSNWPSLKHIVDGLLKGTGVDNQGLATIAGSLSNYSINRQKIIDGQVKQKYDAMLHPPLTYLGDAFQYRTADGKFNSAINPHLGQAGAPYAKTVPSKTAPLGALPDPADLFDKLMAREEGGRQSQSGLSSMLVYHATIIIHDIFRTNNDDKNISDSSSYLDLSPLYGYTMEMQRKVRDGKYKLGLLKPDTFAEDRLLRQPPGVCIMLVMYNRYHNYAARQLARINENGRFSVPQQYSKTKLVSLVKAFFSDPNVDTSTPCEEYEKAWKDWVAAQPEGDVPDKPATGGGVESDESPEGKALAHCTEILEAFLSSVDPKAREAFEEAHDAAWSKLDDDLFNTARLITCGMYVQVSVHDYLRALMGFHQFDTNFTLDPRADFDQRKTTRGIGNQVTVEFNLLYRFHCAISLRDETYTEEFMKKVMGFDDPKSVPLPLFLAKMVETQYAGAKNPWEVKFGIPDEVPTHNGNDSSKPTQNGNGNGSTTLTQNGHGNGSACLSGGNKQMFSVPPAAAQSQNFVRNPITKLFDDGQMLNALTQAMDEPISNFGPRNVPKCLKPVEILGIMQARKWGVGTLNDFRDFFRLPRHATFESVTKNVDIQNALRDLYEHPDKIELYPGIFCESDEYMGLDPGPTEANSALWSAIFSDAITLVRSDRFYTVDWNTNSLTSWGMKEVTPDNDICKSSVFHRLIQRAFPGWFPPDTIRFFHPFYTSQQNANFAKAQSHDSDFKETEASTKLVVDPVHKPGKPWYLDQVESISEVLRKHSGNFVNPALYNHQSSWPKVVAAVLEDDKKPTVSPAVLDRQVMAVEADLKRYLNELMRSIVNRESVAMTKSTFQIDATRDFAIPVVTRYVADFLGFGDKICTDATDQKDKYTENEIYQHITNCQVFLSYNADETKWMKRRKAFRDSMKFLTELARRGSIWEASQSWFMRSLCGKKDTNPMFELGVFVARQVLEYERDQAKAAAILLIVCLDFAYNAVVSFTATLEGYIKELYRAADTPSSQVPSLPVPQWITVQGLAFGTTSDADSELEKKVRVMSRRTVRLPIVRKAITSQNYQFGQVTKGQTVILDISKATAAAEQEGNGDEVAFLASQLGIADKYAVFSPRRYAAIALTSMVKFVAQMKNVRRGHDAQGKLKRVRIDSTAEGYANYMAPMRVRWIRKHDPNKVVFSDDILKPETDTYLTPTWDEMVPFPMTWKVRFDGFGRSNYFKDGHPYALVKTVPSLPDYCPPWYQPVGPSHVGGSFSDVLCVCAAAKADAGPVDSRLQGSAERTHEHHCPCLGQSYKALAIQTPRVSTGCGLAK